MNDMDTLVKVTETEATAAVETATEAVQDAAPAVDTLVSEAESLVNSADESAEMVGQAAAEAIAATEEAAPAPDVVEAAPEAAVEAVEIVEVLTDDTVEVVEVVEIDDEHVVAAVDTFELDEFEDEADMASSSMADLVDDFQYKPLKAGDTRDGIIVSITPTEILVDVGAKSEGFVHQREMERLGKEYLDSLSVGDSVVVYVVRPEDRDGNIVLSLSRAQQERDWRDAEALLESGDVFESAVIGFNRGGVICRVGKVRGFIPASQLVTKGEAKGDANEETRYASMVGKSLWLKVVELDRKRNRLILSERLAQRERRRGRKDELLSELKKGDVRKGRISSLAKFGAFVDLGGADGLIHLSELSWSRVNHPNEVIQVGDEVQVYVLNVDRDRKRIGLSLRRLEPEPWSVVHDRYAVGQVVEGVITKLASFGAFARVDGTLEGLIHISELANHRVTHPREVVKEGDVLNLRIIRIDPARRRMGLSLKRAAEEEYAEVDWRAADLDDDDEATDWAVAEE